MYLWWYTLERIFDLYYLQTENLIDEEKLENHLEKTPHKTLCVYIHLT